MMNEEINIAILSLWREYILNEEINNKRMISNKDKT